MHLMFLENSCTPFCYFVLSVASSVFSPIRSICSSARLLYVIFDCLHSLFPLFQNSTLFSTHSHHSFIRHPHTMALNSPWPVHLTYFQTQYIHGFLATYSICFINLTQHVALIIAFSVLKIATLFFCRHHVSLAYSITDRAQL